MNPGNFGTGKDVLILYYFIDVETEAQSGAAIGTRSDINDESQNKTNLSLLIHAVKGNIYQVPTPDQAVKIQSCTRLSNLLL